jgi:hypothetical protein
MAFRYNYFIGNNVVDKISAGCSRVAQINDMNRRRPKGIDAQAIGMGKASQINQNIHLVLPYQFSGNGIIHLTDIEKLIRFLFGPFSIIAVVILAV